MSQEAMDFLMRVLELHGWPTAVLLVVVGALFVVGRWVAPKIEAWVGALVKSHTELVETLGKSVEEISGAMAVSQTKYEVQEAEKTLSLARIENKIDKLKEDMSELKHG